MPNNIAKKSAGGQTKTTIHRESDELERIADCKVESLVT